MAEPGQAIQGFAPPNSVAVVLHTREVHMYPVAESELDQIGNASLYFSLDVGLLGISIGAFIALGITLLTVEINSPLKFTTFAGLEFLSGLAVIFFGVRTILSWRQMRGAVTNIKARSD